MYHLSEYWIVGNIRCKRKKEIMRKKPPRSKKLEAGRRYIKSEVQENRIQKEREGKQNKTKPSKILNSSPP